jgi:hypothetical protein
MLVVQAQVDLAVVVDIMTMKAVVILNLTSKKVLVANPIRAAAKS